jgi:His-Xaa-Ser system radical SAM maturase HxsC
MRKVAVTLSDGVDAQVRRVVAIGDLPGQWVPELHFLALVRSDADREVVGRLVAAGATNVAWVASDALNDGDVVSPLADGRQVIVQHRLSDQHHSLLLTNRCNSYCLMCSQPPTPQDDSWLVDEALDVVRHMSESPVVLGLSGGEPLLLGQRLRQVLDGIADYHSTTAIEVLTNGRLLGDPGVAQPLLEGLKPSTTWLVPLYGHADFVHDFVVQSPGAFEQTIAGLLALQERKQAIQLRVVLIRPTLQVLPELCAFIGRNLPFVREVALIAAEPIGFALANRDLCEVDLGDWEGALRQAARVLRRHSVPFLFMNTPHCALPRDLWPHAHRSISDWKNVYDGECAGCSVRSQCSGLFAWHERGWKPTRIQAVEDVSA